MDNIAPCRICFTYNKKMHSVTNVPLLDLYEKLTSVKLSDFSNICRNNLCSMCYAQLRRCHSFQQAAIKAAHFLEQLYLDRIQLTTEVISMFNQTPVHNYTVTPVDTVNIEAEVEERNIKQEIDRDDDSQEALEITSQNTEVKVEFESRGSSGSDTTLSAASDSEEDMPLHKLKNVKGKRKENMKEDATTDYNDAKLGFQEVILTEQQQKEAMAARALSDNYLHAPHRCTMCCRGFNNLETFKNHLEKHVESSGPNICKLCSIRYKSERLLKAHTHAAHARQYICNQCNVVCSTRHQASDHARIHSGDFYECKLCGKRFHARTSYLTHMRATHAAAARHVCVACGENFISNHGLRMHQARAHARAKNVEEKSTRPEDRRCVPCNVQFLCRRAWLIHTLTTPSHKQLALDTKECPICKKVIPDPMSDHLTQHEAELKRARDKPPAAPPGVKVDCGQCSLSFATRSRMAAHVRRMHLGLKYNKNLVCEVCGKKCTSGATLRYHQRTHTGERPHTCTAPGCGKRFTDTNQLRIHTRTHTGERPYTCEQCGMRFAQKPALNRHYRVHTGAKPYTCQLCTKSFSQSNSLNTHVKAVHLKMNAKKRQRTVTGKNDLRKIRCTESVSLLSANSKLDVGEQ